MAKQRTNIISKSLGEKFNIAKIPTLQRKPNPRRAPSVNSVAEKALRSDFVTLLERYISKLRRNPLAFNNTLPTPREHAFSKAQLAKPLDISTGKYFRSVYSDLSVLNETAHLHTHNTLQSFYSASPSLKDICSFVSLNQTGKRINSVILVFDLGNSYQHFIALARKMHSEAVWRQHDRKSPNFSEKELKNLRNWGGQASKEFAVSGKVIMQPTKNLIGLSKVKKTRLFEKIGREIERVNSKLLSVEDAKAHLKNHVSEKYGKLFRLRYFPTPGYKYNSERKEFVKI